MKLRGSFEDITGISSHWVHLAHTEKCFGCLHRAGRKMPYSFVSTSSCSKAVLQMDRDRGSASEMSRESVVMSHSGQCSGLHQNPKIYLCITASLI